MTDARTDAFLATAQQAVRTSAGGDALDGLGWWELLAELDDPDARAAVFALFRAQGRELASTPALGGLLAAPYLEAAGRPPGEAIATVSRRSPRRGEITVVVGDAGGRPLIVDRVGDGARLVRADAVELVAVDVAGRLALAEARLDPSAGEQLVGESEIAAVRADSLALGRLALALEILGAAETAVAMAVTYAGDREQFGQPIGSFQAVRHLLAWAQTDVVAVDALTRQALELGGAAPARFDEIAKALAGRNGRRACQRALQTFGGIGFTAEHDHHHFASRVMVLDALLGSAAELSHDLGRSWRETAADPGIPEAILLGRV